MLPEQGKALSAARVANENIAKQSEVEQIAHEIAALESEEIGGMEVRMARQGGTRGQGSGTRLPAYTRSTGPANRSIPTRAAPPPVGPPLSAKKISLDPNLAEKIGIPKVQRRFVVRNAEIFKEEMAARKNIADLSRRSSLAHEATQARIKAEYPRSVIEEPTGITGPKPPRSDTHLRKSDTAYAPGRGVVVEAKATAFVRQDGVLVTAGRDVAKGVESDQIQCYEVLYNELNRPVVVIGANGKIFGPNPVGEGWIQIGGPGF